MKIGIDKIGYYVPRYYMDMTSLAKERNQDVNKYKVGIGQHKMSIISPAEDIVTMALEAAKSILTQEDKDAIDTILFATETAIDYSKAAGNYVHRMLGLQHNIRILELKQACYAATGSLQLALDYVRMQPNKKVLVLSSDVAWYGFNTPGEATQGAGAIAMLVSTNPRLAEVHKGTFTTEELPDFYRPSYQEIPIVDGHLSIRCYNDMLKKVDPNKNFIYTCFHMPFANMAVKANKVYSHPISDEKIETVKAFTQEVGNIYNGSLFLSLISVLSLAKETLDDQTIGMFSYGSGAIGEFFSVTIQKGYEDVFNKDAMLKHLDDRDEIDFETYVQFMSFYKEKEVTHQFIESDFKPHPQSHYVLEQMIQGHRIYKKVSE
jgi:hydroxymethylglutaryl-CoA synthase